MLALIRDLFKHQAWGDAEIWRFVDGTPAAHSDKKILELLNHVHAVQRYFFSAVQGEPLTREELTRELPLADLRESYQRFHGSVDRYMPKLRESRLKDPIVVPWFPDFQPKCSEALVQTATHSLHHRAQIAMLLRQMGGDPKPLDYIVWTSKGRPEPQWDAAAAV
jgi:uncharacterized damage-inducible protein DinB